MWTHHRLQEIHGNTTKSLTLLLYNLTIISNSSLMLILFLLHLCEGSVLSGFKGGDSLRLCGLEAALLSVQDAVVHADLLLQTLLVAHQRVVVAALLFDLATYVSQLRLQLGHHRAQVLQLHVVPVLGIPEGVLQTSFLQDDNRATVTCFSAQLLIDQVIVRCVCLTSALMDSVSACRLWILQPVSLHSAFSASTCCSSGLSLLLTHCAS